MVGGSGEVTKVRKKKQNNNKHKTEQTSFAQKKKECGRVRKRSETLEEQVRGGIQVLINDDHGKKPTRVHP